MCSAAMLATGLGMLWYGQYLGGAGFVQVGLLPRVGLCGCTAAVSCCLLVGHACNWVLSGSLSGTVSVRSSPSVDCFQIVTYLICPLKETGASNSVSQQKMWFAACSFQKKLEVRK